jgi:hypothetical protein
MPRRRSLGALVADAATVSAPIAPAVIPPTHNARNIVQAILLITILRQIRVCKIRHISIDSNRNRVEMQKAQWGKADRAGDLPD